MTIPAKRNRHLIKLNSVFYSVCLLCINLHEAFGTKLGHSSCVVFSLLVVNLMQILFSYIPASHIIISTLAQNLSLSSTESTSLKPNVSSQSDNVSVGVSLTPTPGLPLRSRASAITEVSSQDGFFSSSFSSFGSQSASSLMSESFSFFLA